MKSNCSSLNINTTGNRLCFKLWTDLFQLSENRVGPILFETMAILKALNIGGLHQKCNALWRPQPKFG